LYREAAELGHAVAHNNLGRLYETGRGVARDLREARKWYQQAADQGNQQARQRLDKLK
jgi:TPR repeat protein